MSYTIGEVAKMFNLSISTLRFYDKEGLILNLERDSSGIRKFNDNNIETIRLIECLKKADMQIKDIKEFIHWVSLGDKTISKRREMFLRQKENVENKIRELEKTLAMINFKCWYYEKALEDHTEDKVKNIPIDKLPEDIKIFYNKAHS